MTPVLTKAEMERFFQETRGKVPIEVLVRHFDAGRNGKRLRLDTTLARLTDEGKITKVGDGVWQWAEYSS